MYTKPAKRQLLVTLSIMDFTHNRSNIPDLAKIVHVIYKPIYALLHILNFFLKYAFLRRRISTRNDCIISQTLYGVTLRLNREFNFMRHSSKQPKLFPLPMLLTYMFLVAIWYFHYPITPNGSDVAM